MAPPFLTSALDGGEWSASRLYPVTLWIGGYWSQRRVWTQWQREESLAPAENRTPLVQSVT
jgi:hypothetical protein